MKSDIHTCRLIPIDIKLSVSVVTAHVVVSISDICPSIPIDNQQLTRGNSINSTTGLFLGELRVFNPKRDWEPRIKFLN